MKKKGILISFEGGEGGGKTTQIPLIRERLEKGGYEVIQVREPGGTKISEQIREVVLSAKNEGMSFTAEVLLFQAARAQVYYEIVLPALKEGKVVLMDRTRDSSVVYQGAVRGFGKDLIEELNMMSTQDTCPSLTFLLDVTTELGMKRTAAVKKLDRIEGEKADFHEQIRQEYLALAKADKTGRWVIIDGTQPVEEVSEKIWKKIAEKLKV